MRTALLILAILVAAVGIMVAITLKPTGFERCVTIIGRDIDEKATQTGTTLDPRDVEVKAAKICAGENTAQ